MNRQRSWPSESAETAPTGRDELRRLVEVLSDDECARVLHAVDAVARGEPYWEADCGLLYHEYVKLHYARLGPHLSHPPTQVDSGFVPIPVVKSYPGSTRVELVAPERLDVAVSDAMMGRRSRREFAEEGPSSVQLSTLLQHGCGVTGTVGAYGYHDLPLRSFPSHGALQAPEVYLSIREAGGVPPGLYHYHPLAHALELLEAGTRQRDVVVQAAFDEGYVRDAAIVFLVTGVYDRLRWKYGERAYRFMCMDAGFLGENLYIAAEALGLGACATSGFAQDIVEDLLGVDGRQELLLLLFNVGVRSSA